MNYTNIRVDLNGIKRPKGIAAMAQGDFKDTAIDTFEGLGLVRLSTLGCDGQGIEHICLNIVRKFLKIPKCRLEPRNVPRGLKEYIMCQAEIAAPNISKRSVPSHEK